MPVVACHPESVEYAVAYCLVVAQPEVVSLFFLVCGLVFQEISFKSGHLRLVEQRAVFSAPQIKEVVDGVGAFGGGCVGIERRAYCHLNLVHQFLATVFLAVVERHFFQRSVRVQWHGGVEQQVAVVYCEHPSVSEQCLDMAVQLFAYGERVVQPHHQLCFLFCQFVWRGRVDGWELVAFHLVFFAVDDAYASLPVDARQEVAPRHAPFRVAQEYLCLYLELYYADGFVHLCYQLYGLSVESGSVGHLGHELLARVVAVSVHCECGKRHKVYAVAFFECSQVGIPERKPQHIADAGVVAGTGPHP